MPQLFPPGDTTWKNEQPQSEWREFNFAFNQVKRIIEPELPLKNMFSQWNEISKSLSERPRKRKVQKTKYYSFL